MATPQVNRSVILNRFYELAREDSRTFTEATLIDDKGMPIRLGDVHEDLHTFIFNNQYGVVEMHRECGKTTNIIAISAYLIGINPDVRIKIVSSSDTIAIARGKAVRELVNSDRFRSIFPRIRPGREWTDKRFSVQRTVITPESTLECYGVSSRATGGRCDYLFLDDIDDEEVVVSATKRTRNKERVSNVWLNLLPPDGHCYALATPWHEADTIHYLKNNGWPLFRKPIVNMQPVWPERWSESQLRSRKSRIGSLAFARGFELVPITSETAPIKGAWFRLWEDLPQFANIGICVDPNNSLSDTADYTAIGVLGVTTNFQVYLLDLIRDHYEFPKLVADLKKLGDTTEKKYKMTPYIGVEDTAYQKAIPQILKKESKYPIIGIKADKSKFIRASRLAVHIENGRVHLKSNGRGNISSDQQVLYDECISFPASMYVDCVDMLGYGVEMMLRIARRGHVAI